MADVYFRNEYVGNARKSNAGTNKLVYNDFYPVKRDFLRKYRHRIQYDLGEGAFRCSFRFNQIGPTQ